MSKENTLRKFWVDFFNSADMKDSTRDGYLTKKNLLQKIQEFYPNVTCTQAVDIFDGLDENKDGKISIDEFLHQMVELKDRRPAFKVMWNKITNNEPVADSQTVRKALLKLGVSEADFDKWFHDADRDGSGTMSEQEFLDAMGVNYHI